MDGWGAAGAFAAAAGGAGASSGASNTRSPGSSGKGGKIRVAARDRLEFLMQKREIRGYICGEDFSIFDGDTRQAFLRCDALRKDRDLERHNNGVTFVIL